MNVDEILLALQQRTISPDQAEAMLRALEKPHSLLGELTGDEFFLADHVVKGARVLPGVAYLEMARAVVARARDLTGSGVRLKNVVWSLPFVAGEAPAALHVALRPEEAGAIAYEISSGQGVHSQGVAVLQEAPAIPPVDVRALRALCTEKPLTPAQCYGAFRAIGLEYGPAHRGLESVAVGVGGDGRRFALADVVLPESIASTAGDFVLHPSVMDAALQAPIGLMLGNSGMKPALPFALGALLIAAECPARAVVVVREAAGSTDKVRKLDIDLCDAAGNVCVRFEDFSARVLEGNVQETAAAGPMLLAPRFEAEPARAAQPAAWAAHWVVLCEIGAAELPGIRCLTLASDGQNVAQRYERHAAALLDLVQQILRDKTRGEVLVQLVVPAEGEGWLFSGLSGLLRTAQQENPKLVAQTIGIEPGETAAGIARKLTESSGQRGDAMVRYRAGARRVARFKEIAHA